MTSGTKLRYFLDANEYEPNVFDGVVLSSESTPEGKWRVYFASDDTTMELYLDGDAEIIDSDKIDKDVLVDKFHFL